MLDEISSRLAQVTERQRFKNKLAQNLGEVERSLEVKSALLASLEQQLHKEQVDVERLERLSLTGLFYTVLGSKEQQVEKERQELLSAQLQYQQAKRVVEALRADQAQLQTQLGSLRGVDDEYAALLAEKEDLLRRANGPAAGKIIDLSEQIAHRKAEEREIDEAIAAGDGVLSSLKEVVESLRSAEGWGTWDLLGGGLLSTAIKHARIDDARDAVHAVQAQMSRFTRELSDVQRSTDVQIDIGSLDIFADYFFDGLIVDWIVQSKIADSLERSLQAHERVAQAVQHLQQLKNEAQAQIEHLSAQRAAIVVES